LCFAALTLLVGCSGSDSETRALPRPTTGPYVSVAVDNHFHDVHPDTAPDIQADRPFVIKNEGRNLHNFTVVGTPVSRDIRSGTQITFDPIGDRFPPGTYEIVCRYHGDQGMTGRFTVVDSG
jgi:plastocyanin